MDNIEYNTLKYAFILEYLIKRESFFINEYKIKLVNELLKININYAYILNMENNELLNELSKITNEYFVKIDLNE